MGVFKRIKNITKKAKRSVQKTVKEAEKTTKKAQTGVIKTVNKVQTGVVRTTDQAKKGVMNTVNTVAKIPKTIGSGIGGGIGAIGKGIGTGIGGISMGVSRGVKEIAREAKDGVSQIGSGIYDVEHSITGSLFGSNDSSGSYFSDNIMSLALGIGSVAGGIYLKSQGKHLLGSSLLGGGVGVLASDIGQYPISLIPIINNLQFVRDLEDIQLWGGFAVGAAAGAGISIAASVVSSENPFASSVPSVSTGGLFGKNPYYDGTVKKLKGVGKMATSKNPIYDKVGKGSINLDPFAKNPLYNKVGDSGVTRKAKQIAASPTTGTVIKEITPIATTLAVPAAAALLAAI